MICPNCGFQNAAGDEFCGSCGMALPAAPPPAANVPGAPPPTTAPAAAPAVAPDVICWRCGRQNPGGRAFCVQCGEKLETGTALGAAAAPPTNTVRGASRPVRGGAAGEGPFGGRGLMLGAAAVVVVLLLVGAVAAAALLSRPGPSGPVAAVIDSPSPGAVTSGSGLLPTPGETFASVPPSSGVATPPPSVVVTPVPTPTPTPRPPKRPTPTPPPTATAIPTPVTCASAGPATKWFDLNPSDQRTIPATKDWCIRTVTFTNTSQAGAAGNLQLFLNNPSAFYDFPSDFEYGWLQADIASNFQASDQYSPTFKYPKGYMKGSLYAGTIVSFDITYCETPDTCGGSVHIAYVPIPAQPH